jgi:hypothetical protein
MDTMDSLSLKQMIEDYTKKIAEAKAALKVIEKKKMTKALDLAEEKSAKVLDLAEEKSAKFKKGWKKAVDSGLVKNVEYILEECLPSLLDPDSAGDIVPFNAKKLGKVGSAEWDAFVFKVIERIFKMEEFDDGHENINNYEDTANGCDEVVWDVAVDLLHGNVKGPLITVPPDIPPRVKA